MAIAIAIAIAIAERLRPINVDLLTRKAREVVGLNVTANSEVVTWANRWEAFSPKVIFGTTGLYLKYRGALECYLANKGTEAADTWYKQARKDLMDNIHQDPQNEHFYECLRQSNIFTTGPRETVGERYQRTVADIVKSANRLVNNILRGGVYLYV